jgi:hypothetical protein
MKNILTAILVLALLPALSHATRGAAPQEANAPATPKQVTLTLELQDLPGRDAPGSVWEVSYQWRIADQQEFDRWSAAGEDPAAQAGVGTLLSKQSFARRNLSTPEGRRYNVSVPVRGELLERLRNAGRRPQVIWLDATVRVRDAKLGTDVIKRVNPAWGPRFASEGTASVRMELTAEGKLRWFTTAAPPWAGAQRRGERKTKVPSP